MKPDISHLSPDRQIIIQRMEKLCNCDVQFEQRGGAKANYFIFKYPDDWQTNIRIEVRQDRINWLWFAQQLIKYNNSFRIQVTKLAMEYEL